MKARLIGLLLRGTAPLLRILSPSDRAEVLMRLIRPLVEHDTSKKALLFLFELDNHLYPLQGKASVRYGNGVHTKHRHINYHQFFVKNLKPGERVMDIGSGNGFLAYDMANQVKGVEVVGIELNESNVKHARENYRHPNLSFIHGDAHHDLPDRPFDVVVLSNVLEHIKNRIEFLRLIQKRVTPNRFLIRVPLFEREWRVPLKRELGVEWKLDSTHETEYTLESFSDELTEAGLQIHHQEIRWGEIWTEVKAFDT